MWQTPNFPLKLSITCFLLGLVIIIWDAAKRDGVGWGDDDVKVSLNESHERMLIVKDRYMVHVSRSHPIALIYCLCSWILFQNGRALKPLTT